ncbi:MAG: Uma2 family endonuclease [Chloroflexi bacterium]|nr:Uma2 family endonuclease [Chloroflexota bacterium]
MTTPILEKPFIVESEKLFTADELFKMPEMDRYELAKGKLISMSPPGFEHGLIVMYIAGALHTYARSKKLGKVFAAETGFRLSRNPDTVRAPDAAFVSKDRLPTDKPKSYADLAPDLVVEVVSPSDDPDEVQEKIEDYLDAGVKAVWVVYPKTQSVTVYHSLNDVHVLRINDVLTAEHILPGFSLPVSQVFEE